MGSFKETYAKCYSCGCLLISKEHASEELLQQKKHASPEHIIHQFLGGRLKSHELLCEACNSEFGRTVDAKLSQQLDLVYLFDIKKDRKTPDNYISAKLNGSKSELLINSRGKARITKPQIDLNENNDPTDLIARSKKEALGFLKSKLRTVKTEKEIDELIERLEWKDTFQEIIEVSFHGRKFDQRSFPGILKIAINFYLKCGFSQSIIENAINELVRSKNDPQYELANDIVQMYYPTLPQYDYQPNDLFNAIILKGKPQKRLLYCYIELFSFFKYVVVLRSDYFGDCIDKKYFFDLDDSKELDPLFDLNFVRDPRSIYDGVKYEKQFNVEITRFVQNLDSRMPK